jgi:hypothetical protein
MRDGVHADTYSLGTGPNTYCAECKSPVNWDPQAIINLPPNCVSCKFQSDTTMRIAAGNPLVPESEWKGIRCATCHANDAGGEVDPALAWWDQASGAYVAMSSTTELCEQCHRDSGRGTLRRREIADSLIHTDATCTTCHDPHSGAAACTDCHNPQDEDTEFIDNCWTPYLAEDAPAQHTDLLCVACHDNAGMDVRPVDTSDEPYEGQWATWRNTMIAGVIPSVHVWVSHNLSGEVDCARCHYADNPWGLTAEVDRP